MCPRPEGKKTVRIDLAVASKCARTKVGFMQCTLNGDIFGGILSDSDKMGVNFMFNHGIGTLQEKKFRGAGVSRRGEKKLWMDVQPFLM